MTTQTRTPATLDDLMRVEGKAELVDGEIVRFPLGGCLPSHLSLEIDVSLDKYVQRMGKGSFYTSTLVYALDPPLGNGRQSISPDVSYYLGPHPEIPMSFITGPPTFAVEIREEYDYDPAGIAAMASRRGDYFEAGTLVVWDVDTVAKTVAVYRGASPAPDVIYKAGEVAEAEPAVPGWLCPVDDLFR